MGSAAANLTSSIVVSILNPIPVVTSAQATETTVGGTSYTLVVLGSGFISGSVVQVAGVTVPMTLVSSTQMNSTGTVTIATGSTTVAVTVTNPNPGTTNVSSNAQVVNVKASVQTAARLLDQATFGPTLTDINHVQSVGVNAYLTEQFAMPTTVLPAITTPPPTLCATNTDSVRAVGVVAGDAHGAGPVAAAGGVRAGLDVCGVDELGECAVGGDVPERAGERCVFEFLYDHAGCVAVDRRWAAI